MNRNFILSQPVSNSELWCTLCKHVYDEDYKICVCKEPILVDFKEYLRSKKDEPT